MDYTLFNLDDYADEEEGIFLEISRKFEKNMFIFNFFTEMVALLLKIFEGFFSNFHLLSFSQSRFSPKFHQFLIFFSHI